jgi:hypothetical protein
MELDTSSPASLITEASWKSMLAKTQLRSTDVVLRSYTGEHIKVLGKLVVDVEYNKQQVKNLELTVVQATGPNLLGRDWLQFIKLDWNVIKNVNVQDPVQRPKFCKPTPFAMREKVYTQSRMEPYEYIEQPSMQASMSTSTHYQSLKTCLQL